MRLSRLDPRRRGHTGARIMARFAMDWTYLSSAIAGLSLAEQRAGQCGDKARQFWIRFACQGSPGYGAGVPFRSPDCGGQQRIEAEGSYAVMLDLPHWFELNRREFESQFALPAVELKEVIALDAIELLPEQSSIKVSSHDLHGPLPEILFHIDAADRLGTFDRLGREAAKLCAISRLRRELVEAFSGSTFVPPQQEERRTKFQDASICGNYYCGALYHWDPSESLA